MTNNDLYAIKEVIAKVRNKGDNRFKLPLILNEQMIATRIAALEELRKPSEAFEEFEKKRRDLITQTSERDESGNVLLYVTPECLDRAVEMGYPKVLDKEAFDAGMTTLHEEYKDCLATEQAKQEDFTRTLEEPADVELKKIPFDFFPELDYDDLRVLLNMIDDAG